MATAGYTFRRKRHPLSRLLMRRVHRTSAPPIGPPPEGPPPAPQEAPAAPSVLVVDDEAPLAAVLAQTLRRAGLRAEACSSPFRALERLSSGERFDVVLCDCQMPGLRGVELLERARVAWPDLAQRILFMSGGLGAADQQYLAEHGYRLLEKPASSRELEAAVRELLARVGRLAKPH